MAGGLTIKPELGVRAIYRRLARNSAFLALGTIASALFLMLAVVLTARALTPREFGLLVLFQSATMMVATLMSFSTQQPVIKLGSSALAEGDMARLGRLIGLGLLLDLSAATVATIGAFAFLAVGRGWIGIGEDQLPIAEAFAASLLFSGYLTSNGIMRLLDRFGLLSLIQAGGAALVLLATFILYRGNAPFEAYCWTWALFYALNAQLPLWTGLVLARRAGIPIAFSGRAMHRDEIAIFFSYCWTTWGVATVEALRSNGDSLMVGALVSVEGAGLYNVAKQLAGVLRKFNTVYASAAFPEISAMFAHGEKGSADHVRRRMLWLGGLIGAVALVAALLLGRPVLGMLFGPRFEAAWLPLVILTAAAAAQMISHTFSMYVQVYAGPQRLFYAYMLAMTLFVLAVLPLTLAAALPGAALAQLLFSLALIFFCRRMLQSTPDAA
jgi:O-antigen/teichoic acid export membrane protein